MSMLLYRLSPKFNKPPVISEMIDKRIGIQTIHYNFTNLGCALQACALLYHLKESYKTVEIIDHRYPGKLKAIGPLTHISDIEMLRFIDSFPRSPTFVSGDGDETREYTESHYDAVVYGSDEIWKWEIGKRGGQRRVSITTPVPNIYWPINLAVPHISYAACIGMSNHPLPPKIDSLLSKSLEQFDAISVRDPRSADFVRSKTDNPVSIVPDPVLLHNFKDVDMDLIKHKLEKAGANFNGDVIGVYAHSPEMPKIQRDANTSVIDLKLCALDPIEFWAVPALLDGMVSNTHHGVLVALLHNTPVRVLQVRPAKVQDHVEKYKIPHGTLKDIRDRWDADHVARTIAEERKIGREWLAKHLPQVLGLQQQDKDDDAAG